MDTSLNQSEATASENGVINTGNYLRNFLKEKGKRLQKHFGEGNRSLYPHKEIAQRMGISLGILEKKLDRNKPLTRDFVIALSALYCLNSDEADEMLHICNMACLDKDIAREDLIIEYLENNAIEPEKGKTGINCRLLDITDLNDFLEENGQARLKIIDQRKGAKGENAKDRSSHNDGYNSISKVFLPDNVPDSFKMNLSGGDQAMDNTVMTPQDRKQSGKSFNKILIISKTKNDMVRTVLSTCPGAVWYTPEEADIPFDKYDALCILGGDGEHPLTLPAPLRIAAEAMRSQHKPVFCEFLSSFGPAYAGEPAVSTHHRLIYSDEYAQIEGLARGDVMDDHYNEVLSYYFAPKSGKPILTYHDHICAHDSFDMDPETFRNGRWGLWLLDQNTLIASFRLCNFVRARLAPAKSWQAVAGFIISFLAGTPATPKYPKPVCSHNRVPFDAAHGDLDLTISRGLEWFSRAGILLDEGKKGVLEGLSHHIRARDGYQLPSSQIRTDCTGETGGAFLLDYLRTGNRKSLEIFRNTQSFCFDRMQVKAGEHYGMMRWTEVAWETCYQDDAARAIIPTLLCENFGEGSEYFQNAVDALAYLVKTTGADGHRAYRTDCSTFTPELWKSLTAPGVAAPCAHYNAYYHAALLLATRAGAPKEFAELAEKGLTGLMAQYPDQRRETSETEEMCRLILPLSLLYEYSGKEEHLAWLMRVAEDLEKVRHPSGGYAEWDTGYKAACSHNHNGECALLANNGDPVADLLYSNSWLPLGFAYAYMVTGDDYFFEKWQGIASFMCRCQIHSRNKRIDGAWTRAMDMDRMEAYGVPHDIGWAPCCIESGWTVGEILTGLQFMTIVQKNRGQKR